MGTHGAPMRTHGAPIGCPWGPMGTHWGPMGHPWGPMRHPLGAHEDPWGLIGPMGTHGSPWGPMGTRGAHSPWWWGLHRREFLQECLSPRRLRLEGRQPQPWARLEPRAPLKGSTHKEGFDGGCAPELPNFTSGAWGEGGGANYRVNHRGVEGVGVARVARCRRCRQRDR